MTLDNDNWTEYFDSLNVRSEPLRAAVTLARVPLSPARAGRPKELDPKGGLLEGIRYDPRRDEIEVAICQNGSSGASLRCFVVKPRSVTVEDSSASTVLCITDRAGLKTFVSIAGFDGHAGRTPVAAAA